jgi:hypothetical protein
MNRWLKKEKKRVDNESQSILPLTNKTMFPKDVKQTYEL